MTVIASQAGFGGTEDDGVPSWSGVPVILDGVMVVPLHVTDTRAIRFDGWHQASFFETKGGDVEYHIFRRDA